MSEKTLKFGNFIVNKKKFNTFKQPITLNLVDIDKIVISDKCKHNDKDFKYFIGYKEDNIIRPSYINLPQISGHIKYFDDGGKHMSLTIEDDNVLVKYNEIWNKIKKTLNIKFHSEPTFDEKYRKTKEKYLMMLLTQFFPMTMFQKIHLVFITFV